MKKSTAVIADRLLCDNHDIGEHIKLSLPDVKWKVDQMTGSGIGGDVDIPLFGLLEAMSCQIDLRTVDKNNSSLLLKPGIHKLEARWNRQEIDGNGVRVVSVRAYLNIICTGMSPGTVQRGSALDGNVTASVLRFRWVEDGEELFLLDPGNQTIRIDGEDYSDALQI